MTLAVLLHNGIDFFVRLFHHAGFFFGNQNIVHRNGCAEKGCVTVADGFNRVEHFYRQPRTAAFMHGFDKFFKFFIAHQFIDEFDFGGKFVVEGNTAGRGRNDLAVVRRFFYRNLYFGLPIDAFRFCGKKYFVFAAEALARSFSRGFDFRQIVNTEHHVLRRIDNRPSVCGVKEVTGGKH